MDDIRPLVAGGGAGSEGGAATGGVRIAEAPVARDDAVRGHRASSGREAGGEAALDRPSGSAAAVAWAGQPMAESGSGSGVRDDEEMDEMSKPGGKVDETPVGWGRGARTSLVGLLSTELLAPGVGAGTAVGVPISPESSSPRGVAGELHPVARTATATRAVRVGRRVTRRPAVAVPVRSADTFVNAIVMIAAGSPVAAIVPHRPLVLPRHGLTWPFSGMSPRISPARAG
jgi:hypothetical protein